MPPLTSREMAHALVRGNAGEPPAADSQVAATRALVALTAGLSEWFGPIGAHALLTRALAQTRTECPAMVGVRVGTPPALDLDGLAESAAEHGSAAVAEGLTDLLAAVVELLRRLIGDDLTRALVQPGLRGRRGAEHLEPGQSLDTIDGATHD